jgi:hypothetical protein
MRGIFPAAFGFLILVAPATDAGAQSAQSSCHGTQQSRRVAELIFGRDIGRDLGVSESDWTRFVDHEMVPRFPDGLTVTESSGRSRDRAAGTILREPSKHVEIVLPGRPDDDARLDAVAAAYKRQFAQKSVVIIVREACVSF